LNIWTKRGKIVVTCSHRIAPYLLTEIQLLGYKEATAFKTGVILQGTMQDCIRLNIHLFTAGQVLFSIQSFRAFDAEALYKEAIKIPWENLIPANGYFSITGNVRNATINNNLFANVRLKDAIADRFRSTSGNRPDSGPKTDGAVIHLYWNNDIAEIFIDTSGYTLSKHGYRKIPGKAPMMESLAAATIIASKWNRQSPFINPMCGSGTLAIEAALIATNRKPALFRSNYAFMHLCDYTTGFYERELEQIRASIKQPNGLRIVATDISKDAVHITSVNAGIAGVDTLIETKVCDFSETTVEENGNGVVFFNPEYGDRLGVEEKLIPVYASMGDFLKKKCKGYTGYIFTGNLELAKKIGLKASRRIEFFNGKIDCRLLEYELYAGSKS
jgi:putative N6-adenine-specific DNA methylase